MSSARSVSLLNPDFFGEFNLELDIRPHRPMASGVFLSLQNR